MILLPIEIIAAFIAAFFLGFLALRLIEADPSPRHRLQDTELLEKYRKDFLPHWGTDEKLAYAKICYDLEHGKQVAPRLLEYYLRLGKEKEQYFAQHYKRLIVKDKPSLNKRTQLPITQ